MIEIWKPYLLDQKYLISNLGRIKSLRINKIMKQQTDRYGYKYISLKGNVNKKKKVHRLVAETFIDNFENKEQVNHKDGNKNNNCVENLEWVTCRENLKHLYNILPEGKKLKTKVSERFKGKKLSEETRQKMSKCRKGGKNGRATKVYCIENKMIFSTIKSAADFIGVKQSSLSIALLKNNKCGGLTWRKY